MERSKILRLGFSLLTGLLAAACSDVSFSPSDNTAQSKLPDGWGQDVFLFNEDRPLAKVDVLFIEDNSKSMGAEQQKLAARLSSFVDSIAGIDWQIAITTTNVDSTKPFATMGNIVTMSGTSTKILTKSTPNYETVFLNTITAWGTPIECENQSLNCPSGDEQPMEASRLAIANRNSGNAGFFRDNADLVVITLSDEDELSAGTNSSATTPEQVLQAAQNAWSGAKNVTGFGIIVQPGDTACYNDQYSTGGHYGTFVQHFADLTDGETGSICANDYGPALASIGKRVETFATTVYLEQKPVPETVQVVLKPSDPTITWELIGQSVRFSNMPKKGTKVTITYEIAQ